MLWQDYVAYVGSFLLLSTFYMKTMIPLRVAGIGANLAMMAYSVASGMYVVLAMQLFLFPINVFRLIQMRRLIVRAAKAHTFRPEALIPFMKPLSKKDGDVLFRTGDEADAMFMVKRGQVFLDSGQHILEPGVIFGEIGIFSNHNKRTDTAICRGDTHLMTITRNEVRGLFFQNPEFGFFLMRLITDRLLHNLDNKTA